MRIKSISLRNFRNYETLELKDLFDEINILFGRNAQGKTNLVEAIGYFARAKSFRGAADAALVRGGEHEAFLGMTYITRGGEREIAIRISTRPHGRAIELDGVPLRKLSELIGAFNTILFTPEDLKTVKGGPAERRNLINYEMSKLRQSYLADLQKYAKVVREKNALISADTVNMRLLEVYNTALAKVGFSLMQAREKYICSIADKAKEASKKLGGDEMSIKYRPNIAAKSEEELFSQLEQRAEREMERGFCAYGPHRDDYAIKVNGMSARDYASQGQQRTCMIAIRIAMLKRAYELTGEVPVLLMDDVFSELDSVRREKLLSLLSGCQCFITQTGSVCKDGAGTFLVESGNVTRIK